MDEMYGQMPMGQPMGMPQQSGMPQMGQNGDMRRMMLARALAGQQGGGQMPGAIPAGMPAQQGGFGFGGQGVSIPKPQYPVG